MGLTSFGPFASAPHVRRRGGRRLRCRRTRGPNVTPRVCAWDSHFVAAEVIAEVKDFAVALGGHATGQFPAAVGSTTPPTTGAISPGKLQLPEFYSALRMVREDEDRCAARSGEHDVFFYPVQAVASGEEAITVSLAEAPTERLLVVVPHEDFHNQREARKAPTEVAEAAATLVGFLTASEFAKDRFGAESPTARTLARDADPVPAEVVSSSMSTTRRSAACTAISSPER